MRRPTADFENTVFWAFLPNKMKLYYLNNMNKSQNQEIYSTFAQPYNPSVTRALFGLFTDPNDRFPYPFMYFN